jgi:hypothetical protein
MNEYSWVIGAGNLVIAASLSELWPSWCARTPLGLIAVPLLHKIRT